MMPPADDRKIYDNPYDPATISPATRAQLRSLPWEIFAHTFDTNKDRIENWKRGRGRMANWQKGMIRWIVEHPENKAKIPRMIEVAKRDDKLDALYRALGRRFREAIRAQLERYSPDARHR